MPRDSWHCGKYLWNFGPVTGIETSIRKKVENCYKETSDYSLRLSCFFVFCFFPLFNLWKKFSSFLMCKDLILIFLFSEKLPYLFLYKLSISKRYTCTNKLFHIILLQWMWNPLAKSFCLSTSPRTWLKYHYLVGLLKSDCYYHSSWVHSNVCLQNKAE